MQFEIAAQAENSIENARKVFERANNAFRMAQEKDERVKLLQAWKIFEKEHGDQESLEKVSKLMPKRVKKRVHYVSEDGVSIFSY